MNHLEYGPHSQGMRIEITDEEPSFRRPCCAGCLVYVALCALGVLSMAFFGDRAPDADVLVNNTTDFDLTIRFKPDVGDAGLPQGMHERFAAFPFGATSSRIEAFRGALDRPLCELDLSRSLGPLARDEAHILIAPSPEGCRISVVTDKPAERGTL